MSYITVIVDQNRLSSDELSALFTQEFVRAVSFSNLLDSEKALETEVKELKDFISSFKFSASATVTQKKINQIRNRLMGLAFDYSDNEAYQDIQATCSDVLEILNSVEHEEKSK
jgi:hypothetical protein